MDAAEDRTWLPFSNFLDCVYFSYSLFAWNAVIHAAQCRHVSIYGTKHTRASKYISLFQHLLVSWYFIEKTASSKRLEKSLANSHRGLQALPFLSSIYPTAVSFSSSVSWHRIITPLASWYFQFFYVTNNTPARRSVKSTRAHGSNVVPFLVYVWRPAFSKKQDWDMVSFSFALCALPVQ